MFLRFLLFTGLLFLAKALASPTLPEWKAPGSAAWISAPVHGGPRSVAPALHYRKVFHLPEAGKGRAILHLTALGVFDCELNGKAVSDEVLAPGWTDFRKRVYYRSYDVSALLRTGENVLGVTLGEGWYSGHLGTLHRQFYGEQPALLLSLEQTSKEEPSILVQSDTSWSWARGPILENDLLMGESYDARRELGDWSSPGYSSPQDLIWSPVRVIPSPAIAIERSPGPPVRRQETLVGQLTQGPKAKPAIYDFQQNFTGRVRLQLKGPRGLTLTLRHGEVLDQKGALYTENLRSAKATDHYTLKGEGTEIWEPRFTFHGFRYAELGWEGNPHDLSIEKVEGIVLHSDLPRTGTFECSNPLLNQLTKNILWGQKSNFLEVPTDCPQRDERLGWTGDAQVFCRTAAFFMDVRGFFHKWMKDLRDAQHAEGAVPPVIPVLEGVFSLPVDGGPAWADAVFICPWTIYRVYGDLDILRDNYPAMKAYFAYLTANKVKGYIRVHPEVDSWGGFGDWLALDGGGVVGRTPKDLIGTAFYAHAADLLARSARLLGKPEEAATYAELHGEIVRAFQRRFLSPDGLLTSDTQTSAVLALHFNLVPEDKIAKVQASLVALIERNNYHIGTGFVGTPYLLQVLEAAGRIDIAYRLLEQESFPSWLFPVKNGATTIWERWDGWTQDKGFQDKGMNSFNHYAYGAVGQWMVSTVAGLEISPEAPGYQHILFKPRPGGSLTQAKAELQSAQGKIRIAWTLEKGDLALDLLVPKGCKATLDLPAPYATGPQSIAAGEHFLRFPAKK